MKIHAYILVIMCFLKVSIYAQESAQVTLTIRLHPIQTIEVVNEGMQKLEVSNQNDESNQVQKLSNSLSTFSTSNHATHVDSVKSECFEALRAVRQRPPQEHNSINQIFSDETYYYKGGDEFDDDLNLVYTMETI